jgi:hypothetical protein
MAAASHRGAARIAACFAVAAASCGRPSAPAAPSLPTALTASSAIPAPREPAPDGPVPPTATSALSGAARAEPAVPAAPAPAISPLAAARLLFLSDDTHLTACAQGTDAERIRCLISARYSADARAAATATALYDATGDVAGLSPAETMDGGFRGTVRLVPELPVQARRKHLEWVALAAADYDDLFRQLTVGLARPLPYRWRGLGVRFMRSVNRTTPSAYANGWSVSYNVDGSLNTSPDAVRELLFHEIFHLNDAAHGDWAPATLGPIFDAIVARCRSATSCLAPYAPTSTLVRGGTYYAFQQNNGAPVHEYAAELALRYYREQRAVLHGAPPAARFKCGRPENGRAWSLLVDEFFAGVDRTAPCP